MVYYDKSNENNELYPECIGALECVLSNNNKTLTT
jgi:hypothetical protein